MRWSFSIKKAHMTRQTTKTDFCIAKEMMKVIKNDQWRYLPTKESIRFKSKKKALVWIKTIRKHNLFKQLIDSLTLTQRIQKKLNSILKALKSCDKQSQITNRGQGNTKANSWEPSKRSNHPLHL